MSFTSEFKDHLFYINEDSFEDSSLEVFKYQFNHNPIYNTYCKCLGRNPQTVKNLHEIPFLPISFFKKHTVVSSNQRIEKTFRSSGTTSQNRSNHHIADLAFYHEVCKREFERVFGPLAGKTLIALLPSYLEQGDSSLISMVDFFLKFSASGSGYFLGKDISAELEKPGNNVLFGVSYALMDLKHRGETKNIIAIETGGMKGKRKEITRLELHQVITGNTGIKEIWSEYGMTELRSQAYGKNGNFNLPNWAKVFIREVNDPFSYVENTKTGGINVIDLANIESCSFIETKDLGKMNDNGSFQVLGRFDNSDVRGCNLLV